MVRELPCSRSLSALFWLASDLVSVSLCSRRTCILAISFYDALIYSKSYEFDDKSMAAPY